MRRTKEQKGITLIALIITIVVLMVLAAVAISSIQNDGIIGHAQNATNKFTEEQQKEQDMLSYYELVLSGKAWSQNKTTVTRGDVTLEVGDTVTLKKAGDTTGTAYKVTVNNKEYAAWRVLGVENGKLLLALDNVIEEGTFAAGLEGEESYCEDYEDYVGPFDFGYNNAIEYLNGKCLPFLNEAYADKARSITFEDLTRARELVLDQYGRYIGTADGFLLGPVKNGEPADPNSGDFDYYNAYYLASTYENNGELGVYFAEGAGAYRWKCWSDGIPVIVDPGNDAVGIRPVVHINPDVEVAKA